MQISQKISWIFILLILVAFIVGGWFFYQNLFQKIKDPITIVPADAAMFVDANDLNRLNDAIEQSGPVSNILKEWPGMESFQEFLPEIQSQISNAAEDQKIVISFHKDGILILISGFTQSFSDIQGALGSKSVVLKEKTFENKYYIEAIRNNSTIALSEKRGVLFISNNPKLIANSLHQLNKESDLIQADEFVKLQRISGKRADAHVFIQFDLLNQWMKSQSKYLNEYAHLANWTGLDVNIKDSELMLNGYTILSDTKSQFLNFMENQKSVGMSISDHFPFNSKSYIHLSLSNYSKFYSNWSQFQDSELNDEKASKQIDKMNQRLGKSPADFHSEWWAGEMARVETEEGKSYAVFLSKSGREAYKILSNLAHLSQPSMITMEYKEYKIKELNFSKLLYAHFGPWFGDFKKSYFTLVGELAIFAQSIDDLKSYIDLMEQGYVLQKNEEYSNFSDNLSPQLNFTYYINRPSSLNKIYPLVDQKTDKSLSKLDFFKKDIDAFSLQMNWKNDMVYTGIFAGLKGKPKKTSSDWQVILESNIVKGPYQVKDHTDGSNKYVVFDEYRQIYLINEQGDIVWKKQLEEAPISDVFVVDYYKNNKIQYLFNTPNYLYMIDLTGNMVKNYPVKLNSETEAGLALLDYNNDKNYRILISGKNGMVYNYQKDGSLLKDWKSKNTRKEIVKPIHHVVANSKDYLVAEASDGDVIMFDRKGKIRMEIRKSFENALGSDFYANRTNSKGMMITTDEKGKLIYIPEKGKTKQTDFGDFEKDHFFIYTDFTNNGNYDFIYLDQKELKIFDRLKKVIVNYIFDNEISDKPKIYTVNGRKLICVLDRTLKRLYVFNSEGLVSSNMMVDGDYLIDTKNGKAFVLAVNGKTIKKYPVKF